MAGVRSEVGGGGPTIRVEPLGPTSETAWAKLVADAPQSRIEHALEWRSVIRKAYGHEPMYRIARDPDGRSAVLPAIRIRRPLLGAIVTSMPFLDAGGPLGDTPDLERALVDSLAAEVRARGDQRFEVRSGHELGWFTSAGDKVNLVLRLEDDPERLWKGFDARVRNQVRKAERSGLEVSFGGRELLDDFYGAFAINMRDLGSPVHSRAFFDAILEEFRERAKVVIIRTKDSSVGGLVALTFKQSMIVPWASCRREFFHLCPNMLLYWEAIRSACRSSLRRFEFGRSTRDAGTYRFKKQWGAIEEPLHWYTFGPPGRLAAEGAERETLVAAWQRLPLPLSRWIGPKIRRYLSQ